MLKKTAIITALTAASALVGGVASAQETWTAEPFPQRPDVSSIISTASSGGGETWAFGSFGQAGGTSSTSQAYRRGADGSWAEVPVPSVGRLVSSAVAGPNDAWTIGWGYKNTAGALLHWDGAAWIETPVEVPGVTRVRPDDVAVVGDEVWSIGKGFADGQESRQYSFAQRWDGAAWQDLPLPASVQDATVNAIGGSPDDLWIVGAKGSAPISVHWDGTAWTEVPVPPIEMPEGAYLLVDDVAARAPDDVWVSAAARVYDEPDQTKPVLLHWNGVEWAEVPAPDAGVPGEFVHAEGALWNLADSGPLRYDGTAWQAVAGPAEGAPLTGAEVDGHLLGIGNAGSDINSAPFASLHRG
ncbi:hypothetical protein [Saccharopolyspora tripterygii]